MFFVGFIGWITYLATDSKNFATIINILAMPFYGLSMNLYVFFCIIMLYSIRGYIIAGIIYWVTYILYENILSKFLERLQVGYGELYLVYIVFFFLSSIGVWFIINIGNTLYRFNPQTRYG